MQCIELAQKAQLHREAYIAVLNGLLQSPAGKRHLADKVGITPQYLSYLLNPYDHRTPGPALAQKLAAALLPDPATRESLLEHMLLARDERIRACGVVASEMSQLDMQTLLALVHGLQSAAQFTTDPRQANRQRQLVSDLGQLLLAHLDQRCYPLEFAQLCMWVSSVESMRGLHANAIYFAKQARVILSQLTRADLCHTARPQFDELEFNALRAEAIAYHNVKLQCTAYDLCIAAEHTLVARESPAAWLPHLYRDRLNAMSELPRFSLRAVEALAQEGKLWCERSDHPHAALWAFMLDRSLARAYLRYGKEKKARRVMQRLWDEIAHLPVVGTLHRVLFLKTYAEACWQDGDYTAWASVLTTALRLAEAGGLRHQLQEMRQKYGAACPTLLGEKY